MIATNGSKITNLVVGASFAALGFAVNNSDTLILEKTECLCPEYAFRFCPAGNVADSKRESNMVLYDWLKSKSLISDDGEVDTCALNSPICAFALNMGVDCLLDTAVVSVRQNNNGGYIVTCIGNSGVREIYAQHVLDTTPLNDTYESELEIIEKTLWVLCRSKDDLFERKISDCASVQIKRGFNQNEYCVGFHFSCDVTLFLAKKQILQLWKKCFSLGEATIDACACDFTFDVKNRENNDVPWLPAQNYGDPLSAFSAGAEFSFGGNA